MSAACEQWPTHFWPVLHVTLHAIKSFLTFDLLTVDFLIGSVASNWSSNTYMRSNALWSVKSCFAFFAFQGNQSVAPSSVTQLQQSPPKPQSSGIPSGILSGIPGPLPPGLLAFTGALAGGALGGGGGSGASSRMDLAMFAEQIQRQQQQLMQQNPLLMVRWILFFIDRLCLRCWRNDVSPFSLTPWFIRS